MNFKIYLLLFGAILFRLGWYYWGDSTQVFYPSNLKIYDTFELVSEPRSQNGTQTFQIGDYKIITSETPRLHFGDTVSVSGKVSCLQKAKSCSHPVIYYPELKMAERSKTSFWWEMAAVTRSKLLAIYHEVLPKREADLLSGIILGGQSLDYNFKNKLATVGLTHVVAASGMNVSFFSAGVLAVLTWVKLKRGLKVGFTIVIILFYATLTGFEPPIVRAVIMAGAISLASLAGRQHSGMTGLCLAGFVMLWVSPSLLTNPSFLLSFSAMIGQIFSGSLNFSLPKWGRPIIEIFLQSLLISALTFPLVVIFFSNFSLVSVLTNPLVLWTIEPIMILGVVIAGFANFFMPLSQALALPVQGMLEYFLWVTDIFSRPSQFLLHFSFGDPNAAILFALGYYLILGSSLHWYLQKQRSARIGVR